MLEALPVTPKRDLELPWDSLPVDNLMSCCSDAERVVGALAARTLRLFGFRGAPRISRGRGSATTGA